MLNKSLLVNFTHFQRKYFRSKINLYRLPNYVRLGFFSIKLFYTYIIKAKYLYIYALYLNFKHL